MLVNVASSRIRSFSVMENFLKSPAAIVAVPGPSKSSMDFECASDNRGAMRRLKIEEEK